LYNVFFNPITYYVLRILSAVWCGFENSSWQLERWERQGSVVARVPKIKMSLRFENNQVNGFGGCNSFSGSYNLLNNQLSVGPLNATRRGCDGLVMNQESQFFSALQSVRRVGSDASGQLLLFYALDTDEGVLYFAPTKYSRPEPRIATLLS
jgi:heat shock protein HslJ